MKILFILTITTLLSCGSEEEKFLTDIAKYYDKSESVYLNKGGKMLVFKESKNEPMPIINGLKNEFLFFGYPDWRILYSSLSIGDRIFIVDEGNIIRKGANNEFVSIPIDTVIKLLHKKAEERKKKAK